MTGRVENRQAVMPVSLSPAAVSVLGLPFPDKIRASPANDDSVMLRVHGATILWDGVERFVNVIATGKRPLLGTALLDDRELVVQFCENGLVPVGDI